jgi:hypothetical protein
MASGAIASAQTNWAGATTGTNLAWTTNANWSPATFPNGAGVTANLTVAMSAGFSTQIGSSITLGTLNVANTNSASTNTLTVNNGSGVVVTMNNSGNGALISVTSANVGTSSSGLSFNPAIALADNLTISNASGFSSSLAVHNMNFAGTIDASATQGYDITVSADTTSGNVGRRVTLAGVISGGTVGAPVTLTKNGTGHLDMGTAAHSFVGSVVVNNGYFRVQNGASFGNNANAVTVNGGIVGFDATTVNASNPITLAGGALAATSNASVSVSRTFNGPVTVSSASSIYLYEQTGLSGTNLHTRSLTLSGQLSGSGNLSLTNGAFTGTGGTLTLSSTTGNYSGTITVGSNTLAANATSGNALRGADVSLTANASFSPTLQIRDNGTASNSTLNYSANDVAITGTGSATISIGTASGSNTGNTIAMGSLTMGSQTATLSLANTS